MSRNIKWYLMAGAGLLLGLMIVLINSGSKRSVLEEALVGLIQVDTVKVESELILNLPVRLGNTERPFNKVTARINGEVRRSEEGVPELQGELYAEAKGRGNVFFADGELRILRDEVLFNLDNLPILLNPSGSLVEKWTRVDTALLETKNSEEVMVRLEEVLGSLEYLEKEESMVAGDGSWLRFVGTLTEHQETVLSEVLSIDNSGNSGLDVLARLLSANNVSQLEIFVDAKSKQIREVRMKFVRPLKDGSEFDFAELKMSFSNYNQAVTIDRPEAELTVKPEVFSKLFGKGEVEEIK